MRSAIILAGSIASMTGAGLAGYSYLSNIPKDQRFPLIQTITQAATPREEPPPSPAQGNASVEDSPKHKKVAIDSANEQQLLNKLDDIKQELEQHHQEMKALSRQMAGSNKNKYDSISVLWNCRSCGKERSAPKGMTPKKCFYCGCGCFGKQAVDGKMSSETRYQLTAQIKNVDAEIRQLHLDRAQIRERLALIRKNNGPDPDQDEQQ